MLLPDKVIKYLDTLPSGKMIQYTTQRQEQTNPNVDKHSTRNYNYLVSTSTMYAIRLQGCDNTLCCGMFRLSSYPNCNDTRAKELSALFLVIRVITHSMVVVSSLFNKIPTIYSQKSHDASGSFMFKIEYFSHAQLKRSFDSFRLYYKT